MMNKYGGVNDFRTCDKRIYALWYQMLRRCYDIAQQERRRGRSYAGCKVCDEWKYLSRFARDIQGLEGYEKWISQKGYCLDKDMKISGNKEYSAKACKFVSSFENIRDISKRNPSITQNAQKANKVAYAIEKEGVTLIFNSEKDACEFLGVKKCSVASCYRKGYRCKGYRIAKMDGEP